MEIKEAQQIAAIKESYAALTESLNPKNMLKAAFSNVVSIPGLRTTVLDTAISAGVGMLSKKLVVRKSGSIFRKIAGLATQFIVTNLVRNKIPKLKENTNGIENYN